MCFRSPFLAILLLPFLYVAVMSQGFSNAKYAGDFLALGAGARSAGLGGTGVSISGDATAGYFNPAGLAEISYPQIALFHESRFSGIINYDYLAGAYPVDADQTVAVSAVRLGYGEIADTRAALVDNDNDGELDEDDRIDPNLVEYSGSSDWAFLGSYARRIDDKLSVGGSLKVIHRSIVDGSGWGIGVDLSARYRPVPALSLAATLHDATKSLISWNTGHQEFIVPNIRLGVGYDLRLGESHRLSPAVDGHLRFEGRSSATQVDLGIGSLDATGGLEYAYDESLFARIGYTDLEQITFGAGVRLPKLDIDYALTTEGTELEGFGATHRVSLQLTLVEDDLRRPGLEAPTETPAPISTPIDTDSPE